jgi:RNA polymerase sigma-70 factor (ECF subfamily)
MRSTALGSPPTADSTDAELIKRSARGEPNALGKLFDRYHADVYRFVARLAGRDSNEIDDLVQDTFLALARSAGKYRAESNFKTWLFGIAANTCRHHVRSKLRRGNVLTLTAQTPTREPLAFGNPHDITEHRQLLTRLAAALDELPPPLREAFVACEIEGLAGVDVARALGIPQGTLWRRLHEARLAIASTLTRTT